MSRLYSYLQEAKEKRDREQRKEAFSIYDEVYKWLEYNKDNLSKVLSKEKLLGINGYVFRYNELQNKYDLVWIFTDEKQNFFYSDTEDGESEIVLPIIGNSLEDIVDNFRKYKKTIIHEIIHFLDAQRGAGELSNKEIYFNTPQEFNAYYQEIIEDIKRDIDTGKLKVKNFTDFLEKVKKNYFDREFIRNLDKKYTRKLNKRLYELYKDIT